MCLRLATFVVGLTAFLSVRSAFACSCVWRDPAVLPRENVVVLARVAKLQTKPIGAGLWNVTLVVVKSWKGLWLPNATLQVRTPGPTGTCGFFIHVGDEMLVYSDDPKMMNLGLCNTVRGKDVTPYVRTMETASREGVAEHQ
jgi:hypothetical protein